MSDSSVVLIEPDPFIGTGQTVASYVPRYADSTELEAETAILVAKNKGIDLTDITHVSRPLNGISVKPDTYAWVQVLREDGSPILLFNALGRSLGKMENSGVYGNKAVLGNAMGGSFEKGAVSDTEVEAALGAAVAPEPGSVEDRDAKLSSDSGPNSSAWTDWILQSVREQRVEKTQVVETFGDTYFYAFGERPRALEFTGLLMNTLDYNWRAIFWENWDRFFRATKLIEAGARMYIGWEDIIVEGYPINAAASETADSPNAMTFRFTFYITNYINTSSQSGYVSQKRARIARIRGGYIGGSKTGKLSIPDRNHYLGTIAGPYGATLAGATVQSALLGLDVNSDLAKFAGANVANLVDGTQKFLWASAKGPGPTSAFLTSFARNTAFTAAKFWSDRGIRAAEKKMGAASGEINAWFGMLGAVLNRMDRGSETKISTNTGNKNANWIGKRSGPDISMTGLLKRGSIDAMIGALAYSIPAMPGFEDDTTYSTAYSQGKPAGAMIVRLAAADELAAGSAILPGSEPGLSGEGGVSDRPGGSTVTASDVG